jgi:serine/threonine protein kinase
MSELKGDAKAIFLEALDCKGPQELLGYLTEACGSNTPMRARVEELLRAHQEAGNFLGRAMAPEVTQDQPEGPGTTIGPYKLLEQIGEGGFGLVFMAEQQRPVRRKVAVKVLKPGMDSRQVIARFEGEQQALALMDHPNIAKVLEAGETPGGRPFFAMELVRGAPITDHCDKNKLTPRERLEIFLTVCQAVQHAHQKGIIHRDLKPSNVLVTLHDGVPVAKVIDFGIAKALGQQLTDKTLHTGFAQLVGTPLYMSPEQAEMSGLDVDTRSDIYSLGVLLYELLTGTTPFDKERLTKAGYDEMRRIIREEEPPVPSRRLSDSTDSLVSISAQRQTEPERLTKLVRGELDWIVMKALEKDRGRRYESASTFAADIDRYLKDEPVSAGPPGASYWLRKFVRRHRGPVLAASLVLLALVAGVIGISFGLLRAQHAAEQERQAKETAQRRLTQIEKANEILGSIFKDLNPNTPEIEGKPLQVLLGERLDQATGQLEGEVVGDSLAVARMQVILGHSQGGLGHAQKAILLFSKARATFTAQLGADARETLETMNYQAMSYHDLNRLDLAVPLFKETFERRKAALGPDDPDTLRSMNDLALGYRADDGKLDLALPLLEEAVELAKVKHGLDHPHTLVIMNSLALVYQDAGKLELALPLFEETLKRRRVDLPSGHPDILQSMNNLALAYRVARKLDLAVPLFEETLKLVRDKLSDDHPYTLKTANNLASTYQDAGKLELAMPLYEETLKRRKKKFPPDHPDVLQSMNSLARGYLAAGKPEKAEPILRESLAVLEKNQPDSWRTFDTKSLLGAALLAQKKYAEAEPLLLAGYRGLKERAAKLPAPHRGRLIEQMERLVDLYEGMGNHAKASEWGKHLAEARVAARGAEK